MSVSGTVGAEHHTMSVYVRFQSPRPGRRGVHIGVFGLANSLARSGQLSASEMLVWRTAGDWINKTCTNPTDTYPEAYDDDVNPLATAWFKASATHLIEGVSQHLDLLKSYGIACVRVEAGDPGRIIYEDHLQVLVVPHDGAITSFHPETYHGPNVA